MFIQYNLYTTILHTRTHLKKMDSDFNAKKLAERRKYFEKQEDDLSIKEFDDLVNEYKKSMKKMFDDKNLIENGVDIWLPYCTYANDKFEDFIKEQGFVCKFCKQKSGSEYFDTFQLRTGYLIAETLDALKLNERPIN